MMNKLRTHWSSLLLLALCGCASGIRRHGYSTKDLHFPQDCGERPIAITCNLNYDPAECDIVGQIKAYDTGFSLQCDEGYVLNLFRSEARGLGADLVNITKESVPDSWSTCYRANAEFVRFKNRAQAACLVSDAKYEPRLVEERSKETHIRNEMIIGQLVGSGDTINPAAFNFFVCPPPASHNCHHGK